VSAVVPARRSRLAPRILVAALFLLAFGWQAFGAISNLLAWIGLATAAGGQLTATAWILLVGGIAIPVVGWIAALVVGRRRALLPLTLVLLALCVSEALSLSQYALFLGVIGAL
jgi:hypothetical protein